METRIHPRLHPGADGRRVRPADTDDITITDYLLNIGLVGLVVLQLRGHRITRARMLLPVVATAYVALQFLHT
ncbi:MAG TPA: hypothetical protein VFH45_03630, partial [Acidimicrobiales bacterium]|nr:hypothetical protein [Acidimicrobiales bacterium]